MVGSKFSILALAILLLVLTSCATPLSERFSCGNSDWYEIGRRDGSSGASAERFHTYRAQCGDRLDPQSEDMYRNGRNAGLVEFCTATNAFELGRMNIRYNAVCPPQMEHPFLQAYEKGQRAHELELVNKKLSVRIEQIAQALTENRTIASDQKQELAHELENLKQQRVQNEEELNKMSR